MPAGQRPISTVRNTTKVSVDVLEKVKSLVSVLNRISNDERILLTVREEYMDIVSEILEQGQGEVNK